MTDNTEDETTTVLINGEEFAVTNASMSMESADGFVDELEDARISRPMTFEGSITTTLEPGDDVPMPCPDCGHFPVEAGATVDQLPTVECPECDWFDVLDDPLDEIYDEEG